MSEGERVDADCFDVGDLTIAVGCAYLLRDDSGCTVLARVTNIVQDGLNPTSIRAAYLWGHRSRGAFDELGPTEFLMVAGRFAKEVIRIPDPVPALQARIAELEGAFDLSPLRKLIAGWSSEDVESGDIEKYTVHDWSVLRAVLDSLSGNHQALCWARWMIWWHVFDAQKKQRLADEYEQLSTSTQGRIQELEMVLEAHAAAERLSDEATELAETASAEGWDNDPTGSGHVSDAHRSAERAWDRFRELAKAALKPPTPAAAKEH